MSMIEFTHPSLGFANSLGATLALDLEVGYFKISISKGGASHPRARTVPIYWISIDMGRLDIRIVVPRDMDEIGPMTERLLAQEDGADRIDLDDFLRACLKLVDTLALVKSLFAAGAEKGWTDCQENLRKALEEPRYYSTE